MSRPAGAAVRPALPTRLLPSIVSLSPTTAWRWSRCRRMYLLRNLVQLPRVDGLGRRAGEGQRIHAVLHHLHRHGSCHDRATVDDTVATYARGDDDKLRGYIERHAERCPANANYLGGEVPLGRFHREPAPMFTAAGTIDALWVHDGMLDARDYKTGGPGAGELTDDVRARVQLWLLAPIAAERRLQLRLRYEFLAPEVQEDPPPVDADADLLARVEEDLRTMVDAMRSEREFPGCADATVCRWCEYRSVCTDAAVEPVEPA